MINAFRAQQQPKWQIWLNSVGTLLWPKEMSGLWRPALAFASLAVLITAGVLLVRNYGAEKAELAELKDVEQKEAPAPIGKDGNYAMEPVTAEAADVAVKELQSAARVAQHQEMANENGFLSEIDAVTGSTNTAIDLVAMDEPLETLAKRSESLKESNREKAGSLDMSKDDGVIEDAEYSDGALAEEMHADETNSISPVFDAITTTPSAPAASHVVTESELAVNQSRANVGSAQVAKEGKFKKSVGNASQSRSLAVDAELVSLLNAGW